MDNLLCKSIRTFALSLILALPLSARGSDLTILQSDESTFHFVLRIDPLTLDRGQDADSLPSLFETVQIGVPSNATPQLVSARGVTTSPLTALRDETTSLSAVAHPLAEIADPITIRGRRIAALRVYPVAGGSVYDSVEVTIRFNGASALVGTAAPDPHFARIFNNSIANYDQFMTWPAIQRPAAKQAAITGPFANPADWYKIHVNRSGLCRITAAQLASAGFATGIPSNTIHLYNGGGQPLQLDVNRGRPTLREVAIQVIDGGDGQFGGSDYILFYGEALNRWIYTNTGTAYYQNEPYDRENVYWLTANSSTDGLRMSTVDASPAGTPDTTITTFTRAIHIEQDNLLRQYNSGKILDYFVWFWSSVSFQRIYSTAPGIVPGATATINLLGRTSDPYPSDSSLGYMRLRVNGAMATPIIQNQFLCSFDADNLTGDLNDFQIDLWGASDIKPYFNYAEIRYPSLLAPDDNMLDYPAGLVDARARLELVDQFTGDLVALDLADPQRPVALTGAERADGYIHLDVALGTLTPERFFFTTTAAATAPTRVEKVVPVDLYAAGQQADLIVVTTAGLEPALNEYLAYRRSQGYSIKVVDIEDIMDNFSFGLFDPTAIRDYLKYAYENYTAPAPYAVLLVGDGSYDYLDHLGTGVTNLVPPYLMESDQSASDDNYVYFGRYGVVDSDTSYTAIDRGYDMLIARWPVRTAAEINTIVAKVKQYESTSNLGAWRADLTLVADDERGEFDNETFHVIQTETLDRDHIPQSFVRDKIYLWDYPLVNRTKPAVNDAIVRALNDGTLLINYVGHGNPDVWAHEHVFTRDGDLPRLTNIDRLSLFYAASCAIGFFDDPARDGMAEDLLMLPSGGAIGVISASRLVYSSDNAAFNRKVFDVLLTSDSLSIAEALFTAKLQRQYNGGTIPVPITNDRTYLFFGDPLVHLGMPRLSVQFDNPPDSLAALGRTHISGTVRDQSGGVYPADGKLVVAVYDSDRQKVFRLFNDSGTVIQTVDYALTGPSIYRGTATVTGGAFDFDFITPLDVGYGGDGAKILAYVQFGQTDGMGAIDSLHIADQIAAATDSVGPAISYSFPGTAGFINEGTITPGATLELQLSDSSGINLAGGLGHGITMVVDDRPEKMVDLTARFAYDQDNFATGRLTYSLGALEPGRHTFKIKAWDNANNSSTVEFAAQMEAATSLAIVDLLNYPNPMKQTTRFSYTLTRGAERLSLDIFTLSGRKIQSFERYPGNPGYYDNIEWNGDDFAGDRVATGVYIYKATAVAADGNAAESYGKVVVIN